jgi:hypothetical protein
MIAIFPDSLYKGAPINRYRLLLYGLACIVKGRRGLVILSKIFAVIKENTRPFADIDVAFVSHANLRSMAAHIGD